MQVSLAVYTYHINVLKSKVELLNSSMLLNYLIDTDVTITRI